MIITTAGMDLTYPCYVTEYTYCSKILDPDSDVENEEYLVDICELDPEDYEDVHLKNPSDEKRRITDALSRTGWNKFQAAKLLKISRTTLDYKIRQFGINKDEV